MERKTDSRTIQTKAIIKDVLLAMLSNMPFDKITVTEICDIANINRGTFYLHYDNISDVLNELMDEALIETPHCATYQCNITGDHYNCPYGICDKIRNNPKYGALFFNDSLTSIVIDKIAETSKRKYVCSLTSQCNLDPKDAEAIFFFQLNGCLAINKRIYANNGKDWEHNRDLIAGFIQGGLNRYKK